MIFPVFLSVYSRNTRKVHEHPYYIPAFECIIMQNSIYIVMCTLFDGNWLLQGDNFVWNLIAHLRCLKLKNREYLKRTVWLMSNKSVQKTTLWLDWQSEPKDNILPHARWLFVFRLSLVVIFYFFRSLISFKIKSVAIFQCPQKKIASCLYFFPFFTWYVQSDELQFLLTFQFRTKWKTGKKISRS